MQASSQQEFGLNPDFKIQREAITAQDHCVVIDGFLADPVAVVNYALSRAEEFSVPQKSYPGLVLDLESHLLHGLHAFIRSRMSREFGFLRGDVVYTSLFSMVSQSPDTLSWRQRLPHRDPRTDAGRNNYAALLYLFADPDLGGTAFYRWKDEAFLQRISEMEQEKPQMAMRLLQQRYSLFLQPPGYMCDSNEVAEMLKLIPARFNRLVFYSGDLPHSAYIAAPEMLSGNLASGRLTLNCFASVLAK